MASFVRLGHIWLEWMVKLTAGEGLQLLRMGEGTTGAAYVSAWLMHLSGASGWGGTA